MIRIASVLSLVFFAFLGGCAASTTAATTTTAAAATASTSDRELPPPPTETEFSFDDAPRPSRAQTHEAVSFRPNQQQRPSTGAVHAASN